MTTQNTSPSPIRKAFLPGAGLGTRLRPLTCLLPKPLIPFYHEPLIFHSLRRCQAAGIEEVMINTHYLPDAWESFFPRHEWNGMRVFFSYEPELLDTGGGIKNVEDWIAGEPLLVCNADNLTDFPLEKLIAAHTNSQSKATLVLRENGYNTNVAFDPESGLVRDMRYRLGIHRGNCQFTGMYCLSPEIIASIPREKIISIVETLLRGIPREEVRGIIYNEGYWLDLGTVENYIEAHLNTPGLKIHPDAVISPEATLDSHTVVGPGAQVEKDSVLSQCIVWPGVKIQAGTKAHQRVFFNNGLLGRL